jgi:hypothetical protein
MTINASYIGSSTVQITPSNLTTSNASTYINLIDTVTDAIIGTQPGANGTTNTTAILAGSITTPGAGAATGTLFNNNNSIANIQTSSGWSLYDCSQAGYTITQAFRALNADGVTYKYAILRWNLHLMEINMSSCESWVIGSGGSNEVWTYFDCSPIGFKLDATDIIVNSNPRWLMINSFLNGEPSNWAMVVESAREDLTDTVANALPCWGWTSSVLQNLGAVAPTSLTGKPLAGTGSVSTDYPLWCMPRVKNGSTSLNAAKGWAADYGVAQYPNTWSIAGTSISSFITYLGNQSGASKFTANSWNTANRLVLPIKPLTDFNATYITNYGTLYGLKVLAPSGNHMNKISVPVDSTGNYSPAGTSKPHFLLNNYYGSGAGTTEETSWFNCSQWVTTQVSSPYRMEYMVSTGTAWYMFNTTQSNIYKFSATLGSYSTIVLSGTPTITDLKFDGERYVYIGTSTGIRQLDIRTDLVSAEITITNGVYAMVIGPSYIVTAPNATSATPVLTILQRPTPTNAIPFQIYTSTIGSFSGGTYTTASAYGEAVKMVDACIDHSGNMWFAPTVTTTASNFKLLKISPTFGVTFSSGIAGTAIPANCALQVLDINNIILWQCVTSGSIYAYQFNPTTGLQISVSNTVGSTTALNTSVKATWIKYDGVITLVPKSSATNPVFARLSLGASVSLTSNIPSIGTPVVTTAQNGTSSLTAASANQFLYTDGGRIIANNDTYLRVFTNVHGINVATNTTYGQMAILA